MPQAEILSNYIEFCINNKCRSLNPKQLYCKQGRNRLNPPSSELLLRVCIHNRSGYLIPHKYYVNETWYHVDRVTLGDTTSNELTLHRFLFSRGEINITDLLCYIVVNFEHMLLGTINV